MKWPPTEACAQRGSFLRACTGDLGEIQGRYRGDTGEIQGGFLRACTKAVREILYGRSRGDLGEI